MFKTVANNGKILLTLYFVTLCIGAAFFHALEGTGFVDSFYWASTTMTSTGYGDIAPKTEAGKTFTILFQQWGIVIMLALTIAWVLGKVNPDLFDDGEQKKMFAKLDSIERKLDERRVG